MPEDIADCVTTLTFVDDVSKAISMLIGNKKALGEAYNITNNESMTWGDILNIYSSLFLQATNNVLKVKYISNSKGLQSIWNTAQIRFDRLYNRTFDNSKLMFACPTIDFKSINFCISESFNNFIKAPKWLGINIGYEAWTDKNASEWMSLAELDSIKNKPESA